MMRFRNVSISIRCLRPLTGAGIVASLLGGCAAQSPDLFVPASDYSATFAAARDVLHSYRFTLDRVDARSGIVTTTSKPSAGFFTPWDTEQSTLSQEWEDTINKQQRRVEIVFTPTPTTPTVSPTSPASPASTDSIGQATQSTLPLTPDQARDINSDLLEKPVDTTAHILVTVERIYQFGWRYNTKSVYLATLSDNPQATSTRYEVEISDDPPLAGRIASEIRKRAAAITRERQNAQAAAAEPITPQ